MRELEGPMFQETRKQPYFTLPFSIRDGGLKGGMMIKKGGVSEPLLRWMC